MQLRERQSKKIKQFRECSGCKKITNTRTLNVRYQDFVNTYRATKYNPNRKGFWIYHTKGFDLCKKCQRAYINKLTNL